MRYCFRCLIARLCMFVTCNLGFGFHRLLLRSVFIRVCVCMFAFNFSFLFEKCSNTHTRLISYDAPSSCDTTLLRHKVCVYICMCVLCIYAHSCIQHWFIIINLDVILHYAMPCIRDAMPYHFMKKFRMFKCFFYVYATRI